MKVSGKFDVRDGLSFVEREINLFTKDGIGMVENMGYHFFVVADKLLDVMTEEKDIGRLKKMEDGVQKMIEETWSALDKKKMQVLGVVEKPESKIVSGKKYRDQVKVFSGELNRLIDILELYDRGVFISEAGYLMKKISLSQKRLASDGMKKDVYKLHDELSKFVKGVQEARAK